MEVKNGRIVKDTINKEDKYIGENIVSQVNNNIFNLLNGKHIYDFKIKMLKTTIHLLYTKNTYETFENTEYVTNINCESFKNYTCDVHTVSQSEIENISNKIAKEIYDTLDNGYCYYSQLQQRQKEEIAFGIDLFEEICKKRIGIVGKLKKPDTVCNICYPIVENTKPFFGNGTIRVAQNNDGSLEFDGDEKYMVLYNYFYENQNVINNMIQKFEKFEQEVNGEFRLKDEKLIFIPQNSKIFIDGINCIISLIKNNINIDDELNETRKLIVEVREEEKREEEERQKRITILKKEICQQPITKDIYALIEQSDSNQTANSIANFLVGKKDSGYINGVNYYGKWSHYKINQIKDLIVKMTEAEILCTSQVNTYSYGNLTVYSIKNEYPSDEEAYELTKDMNLPKEQLEEIITLVNDVIKGQNAMLQLVSLVAKDNVFDIKDEIKKELKRQNYDINLYKNKTVQELVGEKQKKNK